MLYRGHSNAREYKLVPSVLRDSKYKNAAHTILRELVSVHPHEFAQDTTTLDQLARVQHYSLPTRLLDVTWNPLASLYFAAKDQDGVAGEVIAFRIKKSLVKFYDSDTASCIANLAHLSTAEKNEINFDLTPADFNAQASIYRLLQFVRVEKPHFRDKIDGAHLRSVIVIRPKLNNQRDRADSW